MRLFIAIELPEDLRNQLHQWCQQFGPELKSVRWTPTSNLHLTLKFLGSVDETIERELVKRLKSLRFNPMSLRLCDLELLPSARNVRVVAVNVSGEVDRLLQLRGEIERQCAELGFKTEHRPFHPHVTIGR